MCIARLTHTSQIQHFADNKHRFYVEIRCNRACEGTICERCVNRPTTASHRQHVRTFNHGNVNEPIPDHSHIYGGKWYEAGCAKWGTPPSEIIEYALQMQIESRGTLVLQSVALDTVASKATEQSIDNMPRKTKAEVSAVSPVAAVTAVSTDEVTPVKRTRKPKVAVAAVAVAAVAAVAAVEPVTYETAEVSKPAPKVKRTRKPKVAEPYQSIISEIQHIDSIVPTHIEITMEEIQEYEIEYVHLIPFQIDSVTYYKDNKQKLYKYNKSIEYVGRYHPDTNSIHDIPDSDDETM